LFPHLAFFRTAIKPPNAFGIERDVDVRAENSLKPFLEIFAFRACARLTLNKVDLSTFAHELLYKL